MTYEVLALKYRPKVFEDLVGQETVTRTLTHAIQQNRIAHAFLFAGVRGVGKTTTARILAKALNCASGPTVRPCGECPACLEIARGSSLDVFEIDGASNNGVAEVRDIIDGSRYAPSRDRFKIYIIDEVHMLSTPAFNALLKTLEEPPPTVKFIFATTEYHKIPDTILSRCQEFEFRTVSRSEIAQQLRRIVDAEGLRASEAALAILARTAEGSLRDGISALDQVIAAAGGEIGENEVTEVLGLVERQVLRETAEAIVARDTEAILRVVDRLARSGRDLRFFTSSLMQYLRDVLVTRVAPHASDLLSVPGETADLEALASELGEEDLVRSLEVLTQAEDGLRLSPEPRFHLEMALLKIAQLRRLASFEELLARFEKLASGGGPAPSPPVPPGPATLPRKAAPPPAERAREAAPPETPGTVEALWDRLKSGKQMLYQLVVRSHRAEVDAGRLRIQFLAEQKVLAEQLRDKMLLALLEEQAAAVFGKKIAVAVEVVENGAKPVAEPAPVLESRAGLEERAKEDPLVRRFVDTFQGEVEDIVSSDGSR
ncbi:MAG TPA: DNA polymerase III subunit gamma/tau [Vicinamibacteria bacterium]|nr:DNA polymerase III subunit gamma/tau [Vicinamibacteria bacterium]